MKLSTTLSPWKLIARAGVFWDRNLVVNPEDVDSAGRENNDYPWARDTFFFSFFFVLRRRVRPWTVGRHSPRLTNPPHQLGQSEAIRRKKRSMKMF